MMFLDRIDAGERLANELKQYQNLPKGLVIGLPRGGVPVAYEIANALNLPLDIVCPHKIGAPYNPEYAIGAITETGEGIFDELVIASLNISKDYIDRKIEQEKETAQMRLKEYRKDRPERILKGKTIILVDDGLATGSTMKAAIKSLRAEGVEKIIVAVPISPPDTLEEVQQQVDEVLCLDAPPFFQAVGQFYEDFRPTEDEEVIELLRISRAE